MNNSIKGVYIYPLTITTYKFIYCFLSVYQTWSFFDFLDIRSPPRPRYIPLRIALLTSFDCLRAAENHGWPKKINILPNIMTVRINKDLKLKKSFWKKSLYFSQYKTKIWNKSQKCFGRIKAYFLVDPNSCSWKKRLDFFTSSFWKIFQII